MDFPYGEEVQVIRAGMYLDPYSQEEATDWQNPTETTYSNVAVGHGPSSESYLVSRNPLEIALTVYMPYDADVTAADKMRVRGITYDVAGQPFAWQSPFSGTQMGKVVDLKVVQGG